MVSRIDLGPDGGPYVEIDEDAGDLVIRVPNDTVDFDSNDLLNAVLQNATMDGGSLDGVSLASALDADTEEIQNANLKNATLSDALDANNQDLNSVGTASVESLEAEKLNTPPTGAVLTLDGDQTLADDTVTNIKFESELNRGEVSGLLDAEDNVVVVPDGFNWARLTIGIRFDNSVAVNRVRPLLNDLPARGWGNVFRNDSNPKDIQRATFTTGWASVSENDEIIVELSQSSGSTANLQDGSIHTFLEVQLK